MSRARDNPRQQSGHGLSARTASARLKLAERRPAFDFLESKIRVPELRPGLVSRTALVNRLRASTSTPLATVVAPAGYGKTTMLAQWARREQRAVAWVTLDERDNEPAVLLRHIAAALERDADLEPRLISALDGSGASVWERMLPRLASELADRAPLVLVLDDAHRLRSRRALRAVSGLVSDEREGSMILLAGRTAPRIALAPLRASGQLLELGADDLAMVKREALVLLRDAGVRLSDARADELVVRCEGWPAALALAARALLEGETEPVSGDDRRFSDYFRSECLAGLRPGALRFLRRSAVLERMSGPLCDAALGGKGSGHELEKLERANLFLVPLDTRREWYRYHRLFRELLERELADDEPELVPVLHRRAADWFQAHGDDRSALEHAFAAGDAERAATILTTVAFPVYYQGRVPDLERWLGCFEAAGVLEHHPQVAVHGARLHMLRGNPAEAERWLQTAVLGASQVRAAEGGRELKARMSVLHSWLCRSGPKQMLADADAAVKKLPKDSHWRPEALLARGAALLLLGNDAQADEALVAAAECAAVRGALDTEAVAVALRALAAGELGGNELADRLTGEVSELVATSAIEDCPAQAVERAAVARMMLRHGRWNEARAALTRAERLMSVLTVAIPWLAVRVRIELARGLVTLRDADAARAQLEAIGEILRRVAGLGVLEKRVGALRREIAAIPEPDGPHHAGLTPAELRLLPLLTTHLSFPEIAEQLYVSRNTIKTQAISVYRKLGVSSRSEAIAEAHRLGLDEHLLVVIDR